MTAFAQVSIKHNGFAAFAASLGQATEAFLDDFCETVVVRAQAVMRPGYAYVTGALRNSFTIEPGPQPFSRLIRVGMGYAGYVELGSAGRSARPYLMPAVLITIPQAVPMFRQHIAA